MPVVWQVYCRRPLSHDAVGIELRVQDWFLTASSYGLCLPPSTDAQGPSGELLDCGGGLKIFVMHPLTRIVWMYLNSRVNWTELLDGPHQQGTMDVHSAVCLQRFQNAEHRLLSWAFALNLKAVRYLSCLRAFSLRKASPVRKIHMKLSVGEGAGMEIVGPQKD